MAAPKILTDPFDQPYFEGKNGKKFRVPIGMPCDLDQDLLESMSKLAYGPPLLNKREQVIYDTIFELVAKYTEDAEDQFKEPESFAHGEPCLDLDPADLTYRIAETLVDET